MYHLCRTLYVVGSLSIGCSAPAQELDSLWKVWYDESLPDTARMQAMDYITFDHYVFNKPDSALVFAGMVLEMAQRVGNTRYEAWAFNAKGAAFQVIGNYPKALENYKKALVIMERNGDRRRSGKGHSNLGLIMYELGEIQEAKIHYERALELAGELSDTLSLSVALNNYASLIREIGDTSVALEMYQRAAQLKQAGGIDRNQCIALYNIAIIHALRREFEQASLYYDRCLKVAEALKDADLLAMAYRGSGSLDLRKGHTFSALELGERSLMIARNAGLAWDIVESAHLVYAVQKKLGNTGAALKAYELHITMRDSLQKEEDRVEVARANVRSAFQEEMLTDSLEYVAQLAQKEDQRTIESLRADRNRNRAIGSVGGGILLFGGVGAYALSDRRRRQVKFEKDSAVLETQALRSQMNPHFIFNALNSISAFVQENAKETAVSFLTRFARLMRLVLENSRHAEVPLQDDLEALDAYLFLERVRCNERFDYTISVDPSIDPERVLVPPLVAQPFVENAIWHGMANMVEKGTIKLSFTMLGEDLLVSIEDNGGGRNAARSENNNDHNAPKKRSLGTAITQARLDLVGKQHGRPAGFRYVDLAQGTRVELNLPVEYDA